MHIKGEEGLISKNVKGQQKSDYDIVLKRTSMKLGIPEYKVYNIVSSVFEFVNNLVSKGEYEGFYFKYLGRFIVKPFRLRKELEKKGLIEKEDV